MTIERRIDALERRMPTGPALPSPEFHPFVPGWPADFPASPPVLTLNEWLAMVRGLPPTPALVAVRAWQARAKEIDTERARAKAAGEMPRHTPSNPQFLEWRDRHVTPFA